MKKLLLLSIVGLSLFSGCSSPETTPPKPEATKPAAAPEETDPRIKKAKDRRIGIKAEGSGWAISQEPPSGTPIGDYPSCSVLFAN